MRWRAERKVYVETSAHASSPVCMQPRIPVEGITARFLPDVGHRRYHVVAEPVGESDRIGVVHRRHDIDQAEAKPGVSLDHADLSPAQLADRLAIRELVDADAYRFTGAATGQG